jgi:hypothetical protein
MNPKRSLPNKHTKTEESYLDKVELNSKEVKDILIAASSGTAIEFLPGIRSILSWVDKVNRAEHERKVEKLFKEYASRVGDGERAVKELQTLTKTPGGQTLFRKIIQIVDNGVGDDEWIKLLADVLRSLCDVSIERYFDLTAYAISQIDRLSPQSLIILSKFDYWKTCHVQGTTTTSGETLSGDWDQQVAGHLARGLGITDSGQILRIKHSFKELERAGMIVPRGHVISPTTMGHDIYKIITAQGIPKK